MSYDSVAEGSGAETALRGGWVGQALPRKEDRRLLRGEGAYTDDRPFPGALHVAVLRSPLAHGRIVRCDGSAALGFPGVAAVVCGADLVGALAVLPAAVPAPFDRVGGYPLAVGKVRFHGEPVAVVAATDPYLADDALAAIDVEYEALEPVLDPVAEVERGDGGARVHDGLPSNVAWRRSFAFGDVDGAFAGAFHVVRRRLHIPRFTSAPLETAAVVAEYDRATDVYTVWSNLQVPERYRGRIAGSLGIRPERLHFQCPDIGGGFGIKLHLRWAILLCWLARRVRRPVKWVEDRSGHLLASHHGNEVWYDAELALDADGTIRGYRARAVHDEGAYLEREPKGAVNQLRHATSVYRLPSLRLDFHAVLTNKCPTGPNRAYGKVQTAFLVERLIDEGARELGLDPVELRRRNLVRPEEMPYETPTGCIYDGGDYPEALRLALARFDYDGFRRRQRRALAAGRHLGCGIAFGIEASPSNAAIQQLVDPRATQTGDAEAASVRLLDDGSALAAVGTVPQGHGHETVVAQIVADELGLDPHQVAVTSGYDSWRDPSTPYSGTHASRFAVMGVGAVVGAARALRRKLVALAAAWLDCEPGELRLASGRIADAAGERSIDLAALARRANTDLASLPAGVEPGLEGRCVYHPPLRGPAGDGRGNFSLTYAYSVTLVEIDLDVETGRVRLARVVCVHDCGRRLNPLILEGQVHGAIAHQVGAALFETIRYDDQGQLLTNSFKDYLTPTALDLPGFELDHLETPSLFSVLGARGGGEGAGTPMVAAVAAVADALAPLGVTLSEGHVAPDDIRRLLRHRGTG